MAVIHDVLGEAAHLVARVAQAAATATEDPPAATTSPASEDRDRNRNSSSPLLFFVALGFGVVFTNLW